MRHLLLALAVCSLSAGTEAQTTNTAPPSVQVTAEATVAAAPDQAKIDVGVATQAQSSAEAARRNAELLERVLAELRKAAGADATVQTISYSVQPEYRQPDNRPPVIAGYTVSNVVRVTLNELARVGDVIDAATRAGANQIRQLQFGLKEPHIVQAQALRAAAAQAQSKADALAAALGAKVVRILSATEGTPPVQPMRDVMFAMRSEAVSTPVEPGTIDVHATVTLTVEIAQPLR
jgi:uncharacterized protein YggE